MERRETCDPRTVGNFNFRHENRAQGVAGQLEVILLAPMRRLGTLHLNRMDGGKIVVGAGDIAYRHGNLTAPLLVAPPPPFPQ